MRLASRRPNAVFLFKLAYLFMLGKPSCVCCLILCLWHLPICYNIIVRSLKLEFALSDSILKLKLVDIQKLSMGYLLEMGTTCQMINYNWPSWQPLGSTHKSWRYLHSLVRYTSQSLEVVLSLSEDSQTFTASLDSLKCLMIILKNAIAYKLYNMNILDKKSLPDAACLSMSWKKKCSSIVVGNGRGCEMSNRGKFIGFIECTFTFFKVFKPNTFHIHWMPLDLTPSVVGHGHEMQGWLPAAARQPVFTSRELHIKILMKAQKIL